MKIAIDAGHGLNTSGKRTPDGIREWTLNNRVLLGFENEINKYKNVELVRLDDASGKNDVTLVNRTNKAKSNKCDILISIHHNAYQSVWGEHGGTETWIYNGRVSDALGKALNDAVVATLGLRNRGVKVGNMHMNREVPFPSALVEVGFMDSNTDKVIRDESKSREVGAAMAVAVAKLYNLSLKDVAPVRKTNEEIAAEVKLGKWGNGEARKVAIVKAGYDYEAIRAIVNGLSPAPAPSKKTNEQIADEVIAGNWGNNPKRSQDLVAYGYDPAVIQSIVNYKMNGSQRPTALKVGDTVRVVNNVQYSGGRFVVYRDTYTLLELKGDRAVIGSGKVVTAAVNVANLKKV